jgi:hypothetical protein
MGQCTKHGSIRTHLPGRHPTVLPKLITDDRLSTHTLDDITALGKLCTMGVHHRLHFSKDYTENCVQNNNCIWKQRRFCSLSHDVIKIISRSKGGIIRLYVSGIKHWEKNHISWCGTYTKYCWMNTLVPYHILIRNCTEIEFHRLCKQNNSCHKKLSVI